MRERVRMHPKVYEAGKSGDFHSLMTIISENGEDLFHQTTPKGNNILHVAAQYRRVELIKDLLQHPSGPSLLWQGNYKGDTPIHVAAKVGSHEAAQVFIDQAKSPHRHDACIELLRKPNSNKDTVLHCAVRGGHDRVVKLLIEEDPQLCDITNAADESPLYLAVDRGLSDIIVLVLNASSSSSSHKGPKGLTALHAAVLYSIPNWCKILEKRPEAIREGDDLGWTPLHYAAFFGKVTEVQLLLQHDTCVAYDLDKEGQSALHIAAFRGHASVLNELIRSYPDACDILNTKGQTALHAAVIGERANVVEHILRMPNLEYLINEQDMDGNTALHLAVLHKQYGIIYKLARDKRVDRRATNKDGFTAIRIFLAHNKVGYKAAKVKHVLENSCGSLDHQGTVIEYVKNRLDKQHEGKLAALATTGSYSANQETTFNSAMRSYVEMQVLVAALIATVAFTAAFTLPGGYNSDGPDQGMATLAKRAAFKVFVISNLTAFSFSLLALYIQFDTSAWNENQRSRYAHLAADCIRIAVLGMVLAFGSGTYVVLSRTIWLRIIVFVVFGCLAIGYQIGFYLDPVFPNLGSPYSLHRRYVRNLLFDYGIL